MLIHLRDRARLMLPPTSRYQRHLGLEVLHVDFITDDVNDWVLLLARSSIFIVLDCAGVILVNINKAVEGI